MKKTKLLKQLECASVSTIVLSFHGTDETVELDPEELITFLGRIGTCEKQDFDIEMGRTAA